MSSGKSWRLGGDSRHKDSSRPLPPIPPDVVKVGYLKKLKTMKKKYFVLRGNAVDARLEYYDSELKFRSNETAKRSITLKTCFNINKRSDTKQKHVIALYTKNDCFCIKLESEEELEEWLKELLSLQTDVPDGEHPKPTYEHVWEVNVQKKELGNSKNILGPHLLCLTDRALTLVKKGTNQQWEFSLQKIRRCGYLDAFFYMEVGQATVTGAGNLWMQSEDQNIAQNMHDVILSYMANCSKKGDLVPKSRNRSLSANETSKPITVIQRWPTHAEGSHKEGSSVATSPASVTDSSHSVMLVGSLPAGASAHHRTILDLQTARSNQRRHSVSALGPGVATHQRTLSLPLSPLLPSRRASTGTRPNSKKSSTPASHSLAGVRDRCDSLPSRARTTSEGAHHLPHHPAPRHLAPIHRPHSMHLRGVSYSPPVGSSPVSPASGACSTDSAGSSLSMDGDTVDSSWCMEGESRYGHSLTPDEPVILEENVDDYAPWPAGEDEKLNNYVSMERSLCLPIQNNSSVANLRKYSPNTGCGFKSSSPSQGSFMDVYSPCGSSPLETPGAYMPMSPGDTRSTYNRAGSTNHSRGSSIAEEGYVPMAPTTQDDGYIPMDHGQPKRGEEASSGSSCSITSGTPSTDIRFSEYNLERVSTLIIQDDEAPNERPARAYSVGSRPVNINNTTTTRCDSGNQGDAQRVRAFSVGSRCPKARPVLHQHLTTPTRHSSHSSVEPSEDLMEIDFTKNSKSRTRNKNTYRKPATSISSERLTLPSGSGVSSAASSYSTAEGSYMEMSPRSSPKPSDLDVDVTLLGPSPPKNNRFSSMIGRSPPKSGYPFERKMGYLSSSPPVNHSSPPLYRVPEADSGYVEMSSGSIDELRSDEFINLSSSPKTSLLSKSPINNEGYMEMKPGGEAVPVLPKSTQPRVDTFPVNDLSPQPFTKPNPTPMIKQPLLTSQNIIRSRGSLQEDNLDISLKRKTLLVEDNNNSKIIVARTAPVDTPKKAPEGYVEMSWTRNKSQKKSSLEGAKSENEDYLNMTGFNSNKQNKKGNRRDRNRYSSQPIAIQASNKDIQTSPIFPFYARKSSTGTPPKVPCFLPLNSSNSSPTSSPFSSLDRNRDNKTSRRDSKESNIGSGLTTPSGSSSTIFPLNLNSPSSPIKPFSAKQEYELCSVDASRKTVKLPQPIIEAIRSKSPSDESDYVKFVPGANQEPSDCDYAIIKPSTAGTDQTESTKKPQVDRLAADLSNLALKSIDESGCDLSSRLGETSTSEVTSDIPADSRTVDPSTVSRTPSVSSVGEKEIHYASLDLVRSSSEDDTVQTRSIKSQTSLTESSSTSTPSPNPSANPSFTYAEIDFVASQKMLRH